MDIESALHKHEPSLLDLPHVTSVGIGERRGKQVIVVFVSTQSAEEFRKAQDSVPSLVEGYETEVRPAVRVG